MVCTGTDVYHSINSMTYMPAKNVPSTKCYPVSAISSQIGKQTPQNVSNHGESKPTYEIHDRLPGISS